MGGGEIILRADQFQAVTDLRHSLLDHQSVLLHAECGWGKCLGIDTPILMFDGSVRSVQDIVVGDQLMGPDSSPRTVLSLARGREPLWRVRQQKGDDYVVNESHILSLMIPDKSGRRSIINISVTEYLSAPFNLLNMAKGWKSAADFSSGNRPEIDPYMLGIWLGDGTSRNFSITTGDCEIKSAIYEFAKSGGLRVRAEVNSANSEVLHIVGSERNNWALAALQKYDLILNKHIPIDYKRATRSERMELLAGILDSDGHFNKNGGFDISQKSERLMDDIIFLARSLGFAAPKKIRNKTCANNGVTRTYFHCSINGPLDTIPCRLLRKKSPPRRQVKNHLVTGIALEPIGEGDYYGFEIDGDRLFMLGDFTVTHNTVVAAYMAHGAMTKRRRVTFGVHRRELARQTALTFDRFGIRYGFIAANMRSDPFALVQIASHGTLANRPSLLKCDLFVPDEAHLWGAKSRAEMITEVRGLGAHIVPLTATPERGDGKGLSHIADHMIHGPSASWLIERGHLARYKAYAPVTPDFRGLHTVGGDFVTSELEERFSKPTIYGDQVAAYKKYAYGKRAVGYAYSRKHGNELAATFRANGIPSAFIDGDTPDDVRIETIKAFADGRIWVLFNCQLFREGFDLSAQVGYNVPIQCVLLCCPTKSLPLAIQMMMRCMRPQDAWAILLDFVNLIAMHGLPDDERDWSLEGVPRKTREAEAAIATMKCEVCFGTFRRFVGKCPGCGATQKISDGRKVLEAQAEIEEIDLEFARRAKKDEIARAWDLPSLCKVAKSQGKKPGWVYYVMKARGKTVGMDEVYRAMRG